MRPLRLTMQALGPYAGQEVIDFRDAIGAQLFGIYGQTGSGKSSIFNAITFALFGEAVKEEQKDTSSLRSDHADAELLTEVEFVFEVGGRCYVIRRQPDQMRPKQRGTGETKGTQVAFLFDATGIPLEDITRKNQGKVIAERKVGEVDAAIKQLLGYEAKQFRQIVLLPQGKFESFLAANTKERKEILKELFDVGVYERLTEELKNKATTIEREVREKREVCAGRLQAEGFDGPQALEDGIVNSRTACEAKRIAEKLAVEQRDNASNSLGTARAIDDKFIGAEQARSSFCELDAAKPKFDQTKRRIANAEIARAITDVETHYLQAKSEQADLGDKRDACQRTAEGARQGEREALNRLESEEERASQIDDLRAAVENLERYKATLAGSLEHAEVAREAKKAVESLSEQANGLAQQLGGYKIAQESYANQLSKGNEQKIAWAQFRVQQNELSAKYTAVVDYEKAAKDLDEARLIVSTCDRALGAATIHVDATKRAHEDAETNLSKTQALHLARKLVPGEPCPVCGSNEHPKPAAGVPEFAGLDEAFRVAKSAWQDAQKKVQKCQAALIEAQTTVRWHEEHISRMARPERPSSEYRKQLRDVATKIAQLGPEADLAAIRARLDTLTEQYAAAEAACLQAQTELATAKQTQAAAHATLAQALSSVPIELRQRATLDEALASKRKHYEERKTALEAARKAVIDATNARITAKTQAEGACVAYEEAAGRCDRARETFQQRLAANGLVEADYQSFKCFIPSIEADKAAIEDYTRRTNLAQDNFEKAQQALDGLVRPDLWGLVEALDKAQASATVATEQRAKAEQALGKLESLKIEIDRELKRLSQLEQMSEPLRELALMFKGDNPSKLDLETYAIASMFDRVLEAANRRLRPMTSDRYQLLREEGGSGQAARGLGISVLDIETGKPRSPATLSGGETFIAALALALGLSEIVESVSGKVHLDTIFIDEGFGSLDSDDDSGTLQQVLQVLTEQVSPRRAIGIISHVKTVQEQIPNGFYIHKDVGGSRIETRGVI